MILPQDVDVPGAEIGRTIGMAVGILIPATCLIHAFRRLNEPDNRPKCSMSLALASGGWLLCSITYLVSSLLSSPGCIMAGSGVIGGLAALSAIIVGIAALAEGATENQTKGGGQAVGGIVISAFLALFMGVGFIRGFSSHRIPAGWEIRGQPPGSRIVVEGKRYSLVVPDKDWVQVDPKKLNPLADLAFVQKRYTGFFLTISHPVSPGVTVPLDKLVEAARGEVKQIDSGASFGPTEPDTIAGVQGAAFTAQASFAGKPVLYRYWVAPTATHLYSMVVYGSREHEKQLLADAPKLFRSFSR